MDANINFYGSICLTDIPKALVTTGKNGKKYLNISVRQRREMGKYGETHYVKVDPPKGLQVGADINLYIGAMKPSTFKPVEEERRNPGPVANKDRTSYPWE